MLTAQLVDTRFAGAFTAIVTPFNDDATSIDFGRLAAQIEFQAHGPRASTSGTNTSGPRASGLRGVVISGTTGESPTLSDAEYRALVERAVDLAHRAGLLAIVGTGSNSTHHALELQRLAHHAGADAALSVNPYYNKPGQEGLYRHFMAQADATPMATMLYNIPGRTGVALTPETVERLARHPNIRAIKEATGSTDSCGEICERCPRLAVLSGDDAMTLPFASVGAVGVVSVVGNVLPDRVSALCAATNEGRWPEALAIHRELLPIARAMFVETNPIPIKAAMRLQGRDSGSLRLPMTPASDKTVEQLRALGFGRAPSHDAVEQRQAVGAV